VTKDGDAATDLYRKQSEVLTQMHILMDLCVALCPYAAQDQAELLFRTIGM